MRFCCDLHLHSCLSPCGDDQMSPYNIANMAALAGYQIIALTDHNTTKNCPAIFAAAREAGLLALAGMELTTSEEVHVLCLLPDLSAAAEFDAYVYERLLDIDNRTDIFGHQLLMDENDQIIGEETRLLISATEISIVETKALLEDYGGVALPAHIDRPSFSLLANLGHYDPSLQFSAVEITRQADPVQLIANNPELAGFPYIINSDAHRLTEIEDAFRAWELEEKSAQAVIAAIRNGQLYGSL